MVEELEVRPAAGSAPAGRSPPTPRAGRASSHQKGANRIGSQQRDDGSADGQARADHDQQAHAHRSTGRPLRDLVVATQLHLDHGRPHRARKVLAQLAKEEHADRRRQRELPAQIGQERPPARKHREDSGQHQDQGHTQLRWRHAPEQRWQDAPGGLNGPLVLVGAYLLVRAVHLTLYAVAATGDPGLRRQVAIKRLLEVHGQARVDLAVEAYVYGHLPLVACIVLAALGIEGVLAHAGDSGPLGAFYALPLFGGVGLYLAGQRRMHHALSLPRLLATGVLLAALPAAVVLPPLVGLAGVVVILAALIVVETTRYAQIRRTLRSP
jgi:Bacterial low temperature requirement A protein (LtrA)